MKGGWRRRHISALIVAPTQLTHLGYRFLSSLRDIKAHRKRNEWTSTWKGGKRGEREREKGQPEMRVRIACQRLRILRNWVTPWSETRYNHHAAALTWLDYALSWGGISAFIPFALWQLTLSSWGLPRFGTAPLDVLRRLLSTLIVGLFYLRAWKAHGESKVRLWARSWEWEALPSWMGWSCHWNFGLLLGVFLLLLLL